MEHEGVLVVRDDPFPGGTKARYLGTVLEDADSRFTERGQLHREQ
jgi:hypothetical protein